MFQTKTDSKQQMTRLLVMFACFSNRQYHQDTFSEKFFQKSKFAQVGCGCFQDGTYSNMRESLRDYKTGDQGQN